MSSVQDLAAWASDNARSWKRPVLHTAVGWGRPRPATDLFNVESFHLQDQVLHGPAGDFRWRKLLKVPKDRGGIQPERREAGPEETSSYQLGLTPARCSPHRALSCPSLSFPSEK
jgi:hypothetical protein